MVVVGGGVGGGGVNGVGVVVVGGGAWISRDQNQKEAN